MILPQKTMEYDSNYQKQNQNKLEIIYLVFI